MVWKTECNRSPLEEESQSRNGYRGTGILPVGPKGVSPVAFKRDQARRLCYSETTVPIFFPSTMSVKLLGVFMSNTTIGIRLSMQRLNAVESITWRRFVRASENVSRSKRCA